MNARLGVVPRVTLDLQAAQSTTYKERGVARYALDFATALAAHPAAVLEQVLVRHDLAPLGQMRAWSRPVW